MRRLLVLGSLLLAGGAAITLGSGADQVDLYYLGGNLITLLRISS